jgi:hypothetical protein
MHLQQFVWEHNFAISDWKHKLTVAAKLWVKSHKLQSLIIRFKTERVRFELTEAFASSDFKSDAIDHSATFPNVSILS